MIITKQQWDELDEEQKKLFQEEIGKDFRDGEYPNRNDILIFLGNNKLDIGAKELKEGGAPSAVREIDELWKDVVMYLTK